MALTLLRSHVDSPRGDGDGSKLPGEPTPTLLPWATHTPSHAHRTGHAHMTGHAHPPRHTSPSSHGAERTWVLSAGSHLSLDLWAPPPQPEVRAGQPPPS